MNLKRTLTSIAAASLVLGTMAPVAMAATSTSYSFTQRHVSFNGMNLSNPWGFVSGGTNFFPIYYLQTALGSLVPGATATWDGKDLMVNIPGFDATKLMGPTVPGTNGIYINGTLVQKFTRIVTNDKGTKIATSFAPIYSLFGVLEQLGLKSSWSGDGTWSLAPSLAKLTIAGNNSIGLGGSDTLTLTGADSAGNPVSIDQSKVVWSSTGGVLSSAGVLAATTAGTYTVTATYMGMSTTGTVAVYGAPTATSLSVASGSVVANSVSTDVVTVKAVDANGNTVSNYTGALTLAYATSGSNGAVTLPTVQTVNAVNGVATFTVTATSVSGRTDTLTATGKDVAGNALTAGTTSVSSVAQIATSISVTAAQAKVPNNTATGDTVSATVNDQTGNPMLSSAYGLTFAVSGPGTLSSTVASGYGNGTSFVPAAVTVTSQQGVAGTIAVTASYAGLTSGTATITSQGAGVPAALVLSGPTTSPTAGGTAATVTATLVDANGVPVAAPTGGQAFTVTASDTSSVITGTLSIPAGSNSTTFTVGDNTAEVDTLTASATGLTSGTLPLTYVAGTASLMALTPSAALQVSGANPTTTLSVQLQDAHNNNVAQAGTVVNFYLVNDPNSHTATLGGVSSSNTTPQTQLAIDGGGVTPWATATTNAQGVATITFAPQAYVGDNWQVAAYVPLQGAQAAIASTLYSVGVVNQVASSVSTTVTNSSAQLVSQINAGDLTNVSATAKDANGNAVGNDTITFTVSNPAAIATGSAPTVTGGTVSTAWNATTGTISVTAASGVATIQFPANSISGSGSLVVTAKDTSSSSTPSATANIYVNASTTVAGVAFYNASGSLVDYTTGNPGAVVVASYTAANAVDASTALQTVTIKPVDKFGNPIVATQQQIVSLSDASPASATGYFRTSANGSNVKFVVIPAGTSSMTLYYGNTSSTATAEELEANLNNPVVVNALTTSVTLNFAAGTLAAGTLNPADFTVVDNTTAGGTAVTAASIAGDVITLTLASGMAATGDSLTVTYKTSGTNDLAFTDGQAAPAFTAGN